MSSNEQQPPESAPRKRYQAAIVVPLIVFALLAGFAAGYSLGHLGPDECRRQQPPDVLRELTIQYDEQDVSRQPTGARAALPLD